MKILLKKNKKIYNILKYIKIKKFIINIYLSVSITTMVLRDILGSMSLSLFTITLLSMSLRSLSVSLLTISLRSLSFNHRSLTLGLIKSSITRSNKT